MYHFNMKAILLVGLLMVGCTPAITPPQEKPIQTHPVRQLKPRRMVATNPVVVAVIDTGLTISTMTREAKLCVRDHKNFTSNPKVQSTQYTVDPIPVDNHGHGTNIAGLIQTYAGDGDNYCLVIIKYYDPKSPWDNNLENTVKAIRYATKIGAKYINYSGGGMETSSDERAAVKEFLNAGGKFIAAAGNEKSDLSLKPYYPAMDDERVIVVGSKEVDGKVAKYSNWGTRVNRWELGSYRTGFGVTESGTSQATAIATGKIIREDSKK